MSPQQKKEPAASVNYSMPPELLRRIDRAARATGLSKSRIIQQGAEMRLQQIEQQQ